MIHDKIDVSYIVTRFIPQIKTNLLCLLFVAHSYKLYYTILYTILYYAILCYSWLLHTVPFLLFPQILYLLMHLSIVVQY